MPLRLSERHTGVLHLGTRYKARPPTPNKAIFPAYLTSSLILPTVSHHPPISAFFYVSPANKLCIVGELRPKSKFLGNSVSTTMEGENRITLMGRPEDGGT